MAKSDLKRANGVVYVASRLIADVGRVFSPGAVAVSNGLVLMAGRKRDVISSVPASFTVLELPGAVILPGLVNAHTHLQIPRNLDGSGVDDAARPDDFVGWLQKVIRWRREADPSDFRVNFFSGADEALSYGITTIGEIAGPDISLYASSPLRARVYAEGIGFSDAVASTRQEVVRETVMQLEKISAVNPLVVPGVSPHSLYSAGEGLLRGLAAFASAGSLPVCLHLAESLAEIRFLEHGGGDIAARLHPSVGQDVSWFKGIGRSIPAYIEEAGLLRDGLLLAHNVHLSTGEINALAEGGARFVLCPRSNIAHGNGAPDVTHFVDSGIPFAVGTDSLGSVDDLDIWEEIRCAKSLYKGKLKNNELCETLIRGATVNGAKALSLPGGSISEGDAAGFVVVDDPGGDAAEVLERLVERTRRSNVRMTVVAGRCREW